MPTRLPTHTRAHSAVPPRTAARTASSTTRRARPASGAMLPGRNIGAYSHQRGDRRGVPRADVRIERRRHERLRAEPPAVRADGRALAWVGADAWAPIRTRTRPRAQTDAARGRVCAAGPHRRSVRRCGQTRMDVDMPALCIYIHYVCVVHRWRYEESASHSHTCRILAHRQRPHAIARVCKNTRVPILRTRTLHRCMHTYCILIVPTRLRTPTLARASAVPPRTAARAASTTRRARPASGGAPAGRNIGAYPIQRGDRRGVPRADVRVERRRRRRERLRAEPPAVRADGRALAWVGADAWAPIRTRTRPRAQTEAARRRVCAAGPHRRSVRRCGQTRMDIDTCLHCVSIYTT